MLIDKVIIVWNLKNNTMLKTIPVFDPIEGMTILEQKVGAGKNAVNFGKKKKTKRLRKNSKHVKWYFSDRCCWRREGSFTFMGYSISSQDV